MNCAPTLSRFFESTPLNAFPFAVASTAVSIVEKRVLVILFLVPIERIKVEVLIAKMKKRELIKFDWISNVREEAVVFNKNLMSLAVVAQIMMGLTISG